MKIGLTYDLRSDYLAAGYSDDETAEFDRESTIEAIEAALIELGHEVERIGRIQALVERLAAGHGWDLVFNFAEGLRGVAREAQIPALLDGFEIPYTFSDPMVLAVSLHKGMTKRILRDAGLPTPTFVEVAELSDLDAVDLSYPLFVKPVAEGTSKGIDGASILRTAAELRARCADLLERYGPPVLVETYLPGREFTVGILGTSRRAEAVGTLEIIMRDGAEPGVYTYKNKEYCEDLVDYFHVRRRDDPLVATVEAIALQAWSLFGCRDAGRVDLRCDGAGAPQILELNPLAGLNPTHSDLPMIATAVGMPYRDLIARIMSSALERVDLEVSIHARRGAAQRGLASGGA